MPGRSSPRILVAVALTAALVAPAPAATAAPVPVQGVEVRAAYPHDPRAYTEGLFYRDGELFESTGMEGRSSVRRVRLKDGVVLQSVAIPPQMFGEGIVDWGDEILSLTWQNQVGFRWDRKTFALKSTFGYTGEGWALTRDERHIYMSDGTPVLRVLEPKTLKVVRRIKVTADGVPVDNLNELEWVKGEILANIWQTSRIARIDPASGRVKAWIDLSSLPETRGMGDRDAVLNGIAYDREHDRLFVTGKDWPHLYEVRIKDARTRMGKPAAR